MGFHHVPRHIVLPDWDLKCSLWLDITRFDRAAWLHGREGRPKVRGRKIMNKMNFLFCRDWRYGPQNIRLGNLHCLFVISHVA